jgi:hypothetical protein
LTSIIRALARTRLIDAVMNPSRHAFGSITSS